MKYYLVGGAVRNQLLGLPIKDRDWVVVGGSAAKLLALGFQQVGADFPVFLHPNSGEEYALARTSRRSITKEDPGSPTLEADLKRRDFTINAMALTNKGELIDPFGGQQDLQQRRLRHISPAFSDDPLRCLRAARFIAEYGFALAPETGALIQQLANLGRLDQLTPERIWKETERALASNRPALFFTCLRECGILKRIFPEIEALFGVPQPAKYYSEIDAGIHTLMVLEQATLLSPDPIIRFAALVHDVGKGATPRELWPSHCGHEEKGVSLVDALCRRLKIPNDYRKLGTLVTAFHLKAHFILELPPKKIHDTLVAVDALRKPERFEAFLLACEADARGRQGKEQASYPQANQFRLAYRAMRDTNIQPALASTTLPKQRAANIRKLRIASIRVTLQNE